MGAMAEAIVQYAQPLIDAADGGEEQMNRALTLATVCWNLALVPQDKQGEMIDEMQSKLGMSDADFAQFRQQIILPMIRRHEVMFPAMHERSQKGAATSAASAGPVTSKTKYQRKAERYAPCPCGSGRKYKFCCGARD
jgi:uncharacterized protein YecA (UPF0149 family)